MNSYVKKLLLTQFFALSVLSTSLLAVHSACAMTLDEAVGFALEHESQIKISEITLQQQQAIVNQAKAQDRLTVDLNAQIGRDKTNTYPGTILPTEGTKTGKAAELEFNYPLYTSGRRQIRINAAQLQYTAARYGLESTRMQIVYQTVEAYTNILRNQALVELENQVANNLKQALKDAERRYGANIITRADLAQAKSQYAQGRANYVQRQANLRISETQFYQLTNQKPINLKPVGKVANIPATLQDALNSIENYPAVTQGKYQLQAAQQQYKLIKKALDPTIVLNSKASAQNELNTLNSRSENFAVSLLFNIPLYDGGINKANRQQALAEIELAQARLDDLRQTLRQNIESSYTQLSALKDNENALNEAITSASIALEFIQKELEFGSKTTFDLLTAQQTLKNVQTQQILNQQDQITVSYQLLEQMGVLERAFPQFSKPNILDQ